MFFDALQSQPIWVLCFAFVAAGAVVWVAGVRLTLALDAITLKTRLGQAFAGMLLLGGITSLPEVANILTASSRGIPALAINNLLGSAAINIVLLALVDAVVGRSALTSVVAKPATLMMAALCMLVLALVAIAVTVGDVAVLGVGLWSVAICGASIGGFAIASSYETRAPWVLQEGEAAVEADDEPPPSTPLYRLVIVAAITGATIFVAGYALSELGDALAKRTGLGTGFVGFLLIGIATSMPELSSIHTAIKLQRYEMAFGQVLGTNFVNLSLVLLADITFRGGPVVNELGAFEATSALIGLVLIAVFQVGLLERRDRVIFRAGYDSVVVIALFLGGVALLYALG